MKIVGKSKENIRNPSISSPYSFSYYRGGGCIYTHLPPAVTKTAVYVCVYTYILREFTGTSDIR